MVTVLEEMEEIWVFIWQKPLYQLKIQRKKTIWKHNTATMNFDYITIVDRQRTISLSKNPTGVVNRVLKAQTFPLTTTAAYSNLQLAYTMEILFTISTGI